MQIGFKFYFFIYFSAKISGEMVISLCASKQNSGAAKQFEIVNFCIFDMEFISSIPLWSKTSKFGGAAIATERNIILTQQKC